MRLLVIAGILGASLASSATAIERTVALPYQYNSGGSGGGGVAVPKCTANQVVGVSGTFLVCRNVADIIPNCAAGQALSLSGGSFSCLTVSSTTPPAKTVTCTGTQYIGVNGQSYPVAAQANGYPQYDNIDCGMDACHFYTGWKVYSCTASGTWQQIGTACPAKSCNFMNGRR